MVLKIVVAGATGFVGRLLVDRLKGDHEVIALSRSPKESEVNVEWRPCDLFSLLDAEKGLSGAEVAYYLVHSMQPTDHLAQGTFRDFDLIAADNFLRAAIKNGIKHIIYLGGTQPAEGTKNSPHLESRKEVEKLFLESSIPTTVLRASMIIGPEGSSFHIMARTVQRLPIILCPPWTRTQSQPIYIHDIIESLQACLRLPLNAVEVFDVGCATPISYEDMMKSLAKYFKKRRIFIDFMQVPYFLSSAVICTVTRAPWALVSPLIKGLSVSLQVQPDKKFDFLKRDFLSAEEALQQAMKKFNENKIPFAFRRPKVKPHIVRSAQRMDLPKGLNAQEVANQYMEFLPRLKPSVIRVDVQENWVYFNWAFPKLTLLVLEHAPERSGPDRQLFYVRGGALAKKTLRGRLEFREISNGEQIIAAIHDFEPRLPWFVYLWSQALIHVWVMKQFAKYLRNRNS